MLCPQNAGVASSAARTEPASTSGACAMDIRTAATEATSTPTAVSAFTISFFHTRVTLLLFQYFLVPVSLLLRLAQLFLCYRVSVRNDVNITVVL